MIKASSLFYSVVIALLIAVISGSFILAAYLHRLEFQQFEIDRKLSRNVNSGLSLLLVQKPTLGLNTSQETDLFSEGTDKVFLSRKAWGAHEVIMAQATFKDKQLKKVVQVGYMPSKEQMYSLYLADHDKPLALCGKTVLNGNAILPKSGVKRAYIEGQSFVGDKLINGNIAISDKIFPEWNSDIINSIKAVLENQEHSYNDSILLIEDQLTDSLTNSFFEPTIVLECKSTLSITGGEYSGNLVIISPKQINVSANASIHDVLLFSPRIVIEQGFEGNFQAFASDTLLVEESVNLTYPTVLGIIQGATSSASSALVIKNNASVSGNLFVFKQQNEMQKQASIILHEGATVHGQIHSNDFSEIKGIVKGNVMTNKLILRTPSSVYENHLLNATIDVSQLSDYFVGLNLLESNNPKKIVKWLN